MTLISKKGLQTQGMNKLHEFGFNFNHDFIEDCWKDAPYYLRKHLRSKFHGYCNKYSSLEAFYRFVAELDKSNRPKLFEYIAKKG